VNSYILLHTHPDLVRPGWENSDWQADPRPHLLVTSMQGYTPSGVIGVPSLATPAKGEAILASLTRSFAAHLTALENENR
jgi:creatinine amidohydrolase